MSKKTKLDITKLAPSARQAVELGFPYRVTLINDNDEEWVEWFQQMPDAYQRARDADLSVDFFTYYGDYS